MPQPYWAMNLDGYRNDGWWLTELRDATGVRIDERVFARGSRLLAMPPLTLPVYPFGQATHEVVPPLAIRISKPGVHLDFTQHGAGGPVVCKKLADIISNVAPNEIERIPVQIDGVTEAYEILNVVNRLDCIDHSRSKIDYWPTDTLLPGKAAKPFAVYELVIRPEVVQNYNVFRVEYWAVKVVVSNPIKEAIVAKHFTGVIFQQVT